MRFVASCLAFLMFAQACLGQDGIIEGTISSIDPNSRTISVKVNGQEKSYDVLKKAFVKVGDVKSSLADVKPGHQVKLKYDSELEVVTAIAATGTPTSSPEMAELTELPAAANYGSPWASADGLRLYFHLVPTSGGSREIFVMDRTSTAEVFGNPRKIVNGIDFSLTNDELEIVFMDRGVVYSASRESIKGNFSRPKRVEELSSLGPVGAPRISGDGKQIFLDKFTKEGGVEVHWSSRDNRSGTWSIPKPISLPNGESRKVRSLAWLPDGKTVIGALDKIPTDVDQVVLLDTGSTSGAFDRIRLLKPSDATMRGIFPHYSENAHELYLLRANPPGSQPAGSIIVYRNISLP